MTRILHFADLHLDRSFAGLGMASSEANKRREELRAALRRIVDLAVELKVDALSVAGDLYEHEFLLRDTANFIAEQFRRIAPTPVFIAPGNHDPYVPDSLYRRPDFWPPNVHVFGTSWEAVALGDALTLWGVGHAGPTIRENLLRRLRADCSGTNVALFHGSDISSLPEAKTPHCPFEREDITNSGIAFALLGHYHAMRSWPDESPRYCYPGSPEPLDFGEQGAHYVVLFTVDGERTAVEPHRINEVDYQTVTIDVSAMTTSDQLRVALQAHAGEELPSKSITRVILTGQAASDLDLDLTGLLATCAEYFRYLDPIVNQTELPFDMDQLRDEATTRGTFVRLIEARIETADPSERDLLEEALFYGLRAFEGLEIRSR